VQTATISPISNSHPHSHSGPQSSPQPVIRPEATEAERLSNQITELCSYLYAAEARLPAEQGALIVKALEMAMEKDFVADRYQVVVHVTAATSRRICCDSTVIKMQEDENGEPLSIGRRSRSIPLAIRRALRINEFFEAIANNDGCDAKWYAGDRMDWQMAVSALFAPS